jgi:hypothetical protein
MLKLQSVKDNLYSILVTYPRAGISRWSWCSWRHGSSPTWNTLDVAGCLDADSAIFVWKSWGIPWYTLKKWWEDDDQPSKSSSAIAQFHISRVCDSIDKVCRITAIDQTAQQNVSYSVFTLEGGYLSIYTRGELSICFLCLKLCYKQTLLVLKKRCSRPDRSQTAQHVSQEINHGICKGVSGRKVIFLDNCLGWVQRAKFSNNRLSSLRPNYITMTITLWTYPTCSNITSSWSVSTTWI